MSADLISRSDDLQRLVDEGFELEIRGALLLVHNIPYVNAKRQLRRGTLVCALQMDATNTHTTKPLGDHTMSFIGETPCHRNGTPIVAIINNSERRLIDGDELWVDHYFSCKPEGTGSYDDHYHKVAAYEGYLASAARSIDPSASGRTGERSAVVSNDSPFNFPDTASAHYEIGAVTAKLGVEKVAIVGLGGTGSYVLDLVAKTPVKEIHLFDGDQLLGRNIFRAPGAPVAAELQSFPQKVDYFAQIYGRMHRGVKPHPVYVTEENIEALRGFSFVFICVDKGSARRLIASSLFEFGIPFVDVGLGVGLVENELDGNVRVTAVLPGGPGWDQATRRLPFGDDDADDVYDKGIQIADLNSLNAALAVLRWKRSLGFYRDSRGEMNSVYMVEGNMISNGMD